jgi:hypothetical protein
MSEFTGLASVHRLEIDFSDDCITQTDFRGETQVWEVIFASVCHLKRIDGFEGYLHLHRIEIPSSVEVINCNGF